MELIKPLLKKQWFFDLILVALLIAISMGLSQFKLLQRWDNLVYDFESSLIERPANENIVIVAIDDRSLQKLGRWPWSRAVHARFLDELTETGVLAIGFDVLFMEPDIRHPEDDKLLLEAIKRSRRVVLPVLTNVEEDSIVVTKSLAYITNSAQLSHVNMNFDDQGIARELDLKILLDDDQELPSMALALYQKIHKESTFFQRTKKNKIFINFSNPRGQFRQISYVDVLLDSNLRRSLQGKVILVGMTAAGLGSYIATPGATESQLMSGIEFQANALNTLQSGKIIFH